MLDTEIYCLKLYIKEARYMYYIGIDGGGSYSRMVAIDSEMKVLGKHAGSAIDFDKYGYDGVKSNMIKLLREFNRLTNTRINDCGAICIGSAELSLPKYVSWIEKAFLEAEIECPVKVVNDRAALIAAETKGKPGIGIIAGISTIGCAIDEEGNYCQTGNYGYILGDGGSSYKIGLEAIRSALLCSDRLIKKTILLEKVKEHFEIEDIRDVIGLMNADSASVGRIAELSLAVKFAAQMGDRAAIEIEYVSAKELYSIVKALIERVKLIDLQVVLSGSALLSNENIQSSFMQLLHKDYPKARAVTLREKPEMGAAFLAAEMV